MAGVRCVTYCNLYSLDAGQFESVLECYPLMRRTIESVAAERLNKLGKNPSIISTRHDLKRDAAVLKDMIDRATPQVSSQSSSSSLSSSPSPHSLFRSSSRLNLRMNKRPSKTISLNHAKWKCSDDDDDDDEQQQQQRLPASQHLADESMSMEQKMRCHSMNFHADEKRKSQLKSSLLQIQHDFLPKRKKSKKKEKGKEKKTSPSQSVEQPKEMFLQTPHHLADPPSTSNEHLMRKSPSIPWTLFRKSSSFQH